MIENYDFIQLPPIKKEHTIRSGVNDLAIFEIT